MYCPVLSNFPLGFGHLGILVDFKMQERDEYPNNETRKKALHNAISICMAGL